MAGGVPPVTDVAGHLEALDQALERLRLEGALFMRAEHSESWALEGMGGPMFAAMMHPGAERLVLFHVIAAKFGPPPPSNVQLSESSHRMKMAPSRRSRSRA